MPEIETWCVMVQREVADRFFAAPSTKAYGAVSVLLAARSRGAPASTLCPARSSGRARTSPPRSSPSSATAPGVPAGVKRIVEGAFAHRRKTLANSLALAGVASREDAAAALDDDRRRRRGPRRSAGCLRVRRAHPRPAVSAAAAAAPAKINLALVVGPHGCGRPPRGRDRSPADLPRRRDLARARRTSHRRRFPGGHDRHCCLAGARRCRRRRAALACADREADPGRRGPRRRQLRRGHGTASRERPASRAALACRAPRDRKGPGRRRPVLPRARPAARNRRRLDPPAAPASRRTTPCCWCCRSGSSRSRPAPSTRVSTERTGFAERRARLLELVAGARGAHDLAELPPNDLASSPIAAELLAAGAFRADVSGAGPCVYGLFAERAAAERAAAKLGRLGRTWVAHPAW